MRQPTYSCRHTTPGLFTRFKRPLASVTLVSFSLSVVSPAFAGGYVDGNVVLNPAKAINTGAASAAPVFNNDQFNDQLLVGSVNNDPVRTPSTADPVSTITGNNFHDETDIVIRGRNGLNYAFTRTYNSAPSATKQDRGLGYGWTHSYMMRLKSNDFGDCPNCTSTQKPENVNSKTSSITYTDERGSEQNFTVNETTFAVTAPKGVYDTLTLDSPAVGQHTLKFRNGTKYVFEVPTGSLKTTPNLVARVKYIENAWGDRLTFTYDANGRLSNVVDNLGIAGRTGLSFTYNPDGRLQQVKDWTNRTWSYAYDTQGNLQSMVNALGNTLTYGYDAPKHLLTTITKPLQRDGQSVQTKFKYYENGRTFQQTNSFDQGDTLDYDLYRKSTRVTDARGYVREYFYDENGRMTKLVEPDGAVLLFENQADAIRSKKFDALGYATTYSYRADKAFTGNSDAFGNVTREQDALSRTIDTTYGAFDQAATVKDKRGTVATTNYGTSTTATTTTCGDFTNRPKETRISALTGLTNVLLSSYCWNPNATLNYSRSYFNATRYRDTKLTYDAATNGLNVVREDVVGMPSAIQVTRTYAYDSLGRKIQETAKRRTSPTNAALIDLNTFYTYDALDRVIKVVDALGNEVLNTYDANGQIAKVTHRYKKTDGTYDVRDVVTRTFDAADRVKTETDADGNVTTYSYDASGNVIAVLDAEGHTTRFEYDAMNRRTAAIDATGYRTETTYNLRGDVVGIKNANNESVKFEVDALGRRTAMVDAKGFRSEYQYDENNNLTCTIDANAQAGLQPKNTLGCTESRAYDELNRVTKVTDALNGETVFSYDFAGNRLSVKDAELKTWSFGYDDLGRLISETDHSLKTISYKPDELGNVYEKTNRLNEVTRYTLDNGNRLTRVDYLKDSTFETFGYDAAGNKASAANGNVSYTFNYDRLNRLTSKTDSRGRSMGFTFDKVGNILTKSTYQGSTTNYVYNASNRLVMLRNPDYTQVDYQYDPAGRLLSRVTSNGARALYQYDANGWISKLTHYDASGASVSDVSYVRDRVGNITTTTDASGANTYVLDALYRLKTADYPGTTYDEAFDYDKVGNRKSYTKGSLTATAATKFYNYTAGTNRLAEIRIGSTTGTLDTSFAYDLEGRLTSQTGTGAKTLGWDAKGRLATLGAEAYAYDPMDYRIGRSGGTLGNRSYFLEGEHLESEYSGGSLVAKYLRGSNVDELVAGWMYDTDSKLKPFVFHHDQVNSVVRVTGHNNGSSQSTRYSAFGETQLSVGVNPNRLKYTGREDDATGLYYYRARYYDPALGRFVSEDPAAFKASINFYTYCSNSPIDCTDPSGMVDWRGVGKSTIDILGNSAGLVTGGVLTVGGAALIAAPEPTMISKVAGGATLAVGVANLANSGPGLVNAGRNLVRAIEDKPTATANLPTSGTTILADAFFPGNQTAQDLATVADLSLALISGRVPVGTAQINTFSALSQRTTVGINGLLDAKAVSVPRGMNGLLLQSADSSSSWASRALDATQVGQLGTLAIDKAFPVGSSSTFGGVAGGGFLLYPSKPNTNMMQSVYMK